MGGDGDGAVGNGDAASTPRAARAPMAERMVQLAKYHRGVRGTLRDLMAGDQGYLDLKTRLVRNAARLW